MWVRNHIHDRYLMMRRVNNPATGRHFTVLDLWRGYNAGYDRSSPIYVPYPSFARFCRIREDEELPEVLHGNVEAETDDISDTLSIMETDDEAGTESMSIGGDESTIGDDVPIQDEHLPRDLVAMAASGLQYM